MLTDLESSGQYGHFLEQAAFCHGEDRPRQTVTQHMVSQPQIIVSYHICRLFDNDDGLVPDWSRGSKRSHHPILRAVV
jgi:hypothetical protein